MPGAKVTVFGAPPVDGLGTAGGFKLIVEDRGDTGPEELEKVTRAVVDATNDRADRAAADPKPARPSCATRSPATVPTRRGCGCTSTATRPRRWASRSATS